MTAATEWRRYNTLQSGKRRKWRRSSSRKELVDKCKKSFKTLATRRRSMLQHKMAVCCAKKE